MTEVASGAFPKPCRAPTQDWAARGGQGTGTETGNGVATVTKEETERFFASQTFHSISPTPETEGHILKARFYPPLPQSAMARAAQRPGQPAVFIFIFHRGAVFVFFTFPDSSPIEEQSFPDMQSGEILSV